MNDGQKDMFPSIKNGHVYVCEKCGKCKLIDILPTDKEIRKCGWVKKQKIGWFCSECTIKALKVLTKKQC